MYSTSSSTDSWSLLESAMYIWRHFLKQRPGKHNFWEVLVLEQVLQRRHLTGSVVGNPKRRPCLSLLNCFPAHLICTFLIFKVIPLSLSTSYCQHHIVNLTSLLVLSTPLAASKAASSSPPLPSSTGCKPAWQDKMRPYIISLSNMLPSMYLAMHNYSNHYERQLVHLCEKHFNFRFESDMTCCSASLDSVRSRLSWVTWQTGESWLTGQQENFLLLLSKPQPCAARKSQPSAVAPRKQKFNPLLDIKDEKEKTWSLWATRPSLSRGSREPLEQEESAIASSSNLGGQQSERVQKRTEWNWIQKCQPVLLQGMRLGETGTR